MTPWEGRLFVGGAPDTDELGVPNVPVELLTQYAVGNLEFFLQFWGSTIAPIPDEGFDETHPLWAAAVYTNFALEVLGERLLTPEQLQARPASRVLSEPVVESQRRVAPGRHVVSHERGFRKKATG